MKQVNPIYNSRLSMINFYKDQLRIFEKLGIGKATEHDTIVTDRLIDITKKRLSQLSVSYDATLTPAAEKRRLRIKKLLLKNK